MTDVFNTDSLNFLALASINDLRVVNGENNLETCYQYAVVNDKNDRLLKVKFYDKMLDMIGRDGTQMVGTRVDHILGSKGTYSSFIKRIVQAQHIGMTRLEISICAAALQQFKPWQSSVKTLWHSKMQAALSTIVQDVLHNKAVVKHVYRTLSLPHLLGSLAQCKVNLLLIGRENTWLVNARTPHKRHFVGTRQAVGLTNKAMKIASWAKLEALVLRYAARGSIIKVFCLHPQDEVPRQVSELMKQEDSLYQAPGCIKAANFGIKLPAFIQIPIEQNKIDPESLIGWSETRDDITAALRGLRKETIQAEEDFEMNYGEAAIEYDLEVQNSSDCSTI